MNDFDEIDEDMKYFLESVMKPKTSSVLRKQLCELRKCANGEKKADEKYNRFVEWKEGNDKIKDRDLMIMAQKLVIKRLQTGISTEDYISELKRDIMLSRPYKDLCEKSHARNLKLVAENKRLRSTNVGDKLDINKLKKYNDLEVRFTEVNSQRRDLIEESNSLKERLQQYESIVES
tara:strand:- start:76 stop:606 length:531 start_codon:yes stop_codon:yes gene_type:complete